MQRLDYLMKNVMIFQIRRPQYFMKKFILGLYFYIVDANLGERWNVVERNRAAIFFCLFRYD